MEESRLVTNSLLSVKGGTTMKSELPKSLQEKNWGKIPVSPTLNHKVLQRQKLLKRIKSPGSPHVSPKETGPKGISRVE